MRRPRLFWTLQAGGWLALAGALALSRLGRYPLDYMAATKGALAVSGFAVSLLLRALYRRGLRDSASIGRVVVGTVVASYVAALFWTACYNLVDARLATAMLGRRVVIDSLGALFGGSVYHGFALLAWSVFYVAIHRHFALEAERLRGARAEALAHQARLQALRYQLQPHFLYNALNALSTLILEERTREAARMVARLGDFLRFTLGAPDREEVPLEEEVEFARRYLDIEQVRFGDRLRVRVDVAPDARRALVPSLVLQPLVENAVRHGVAARAAGGLVVVEARRAGAVLRLTVADDGDGPAEGRGGAAGGGAAPGVGGVGLANTRERLGHLYGDRHQLTLRRAGTAGGTRVELEIPYREAPAPLGAPSPRDAGADRSRNGDAPPVRREHAAR